jgi:hypothetical protein
MSYEEWCKDEIERMCDAERYRWLKSVAPSVICGIAYREKAACAFSDPDQAVDAAMAAQGVRRGYG